MQDKNFVARIFDFSFSEFVTSKVIKFLLGLAMIIVAIAVIILIANGFKTSAFLGILVLILSPVIYLLIMLIVRINLELTMVIFRIYEELAKIRENLAPEKTSGGEIAPEA